MRPYRGTVVWEDAYHKSTDGFPYSPEEFAEIYNPHVVETGGWVVFADDKVVVVSMFKMRNANTFRNAMYIPRGMVQSIKRIKEHK